MQQASALARVTIGIPAYNNAASIKQTIQTLQAQTFTATRILISDDQSFDETQAICQRLVRSDPRITYFRQPQNLKYQNFGYLLRQAQTEYFMWAAGDDLWAPDFVARCIAALDADPTAVIAVTDVEFVDASSQRRWLAPGTRPVDGSWSERFSSYIRRPMDNSRMYGVMRTAVAQQCFPDLSFHAYDWAFSAAMTKFGNHIKLNGVGIVRDKTPSYKYVLLAKTDSARLRDQLFPVWNMTRWLYSKNFVPPGWTSAAALCSINLEKHREYVDQHNPYIYHPISLIKRLLMPLLR
jgi:glycosyltransferase involved in cell wall biosynthesis